MIGLSENEVEKRIKDGKINIQIVSRTKSNKEIIVHNTINYFNILNIVLALIILLSGQIKNILFLGVIVVNTGIAIYQEIKSKQIVEKLSLLSKNKVKVIRSNNEKMISQNELVVDDIFMIANGDQIPVDSVLLDGTLEMDESNLTGESDTIYKNQNDMVYSGSIVVSGSGLLKVVNVGMDNHINKMLSETKVSKVHPSKLRDTMNQILKIVTVGIIPIGIVLFLKNHFIFHLPFEEVILKSTAPLIGMIPEGLILLTSVALAVSVFLLGLKKILIQELYCIETLARVDILCVDKTGTITQGDMEVVDVIGDINEIMPLYLGCFGYENITDKALVKYFGKKTGEEISSKLEFSSKRKYSAVVFKKYGSYALGAYDFLIKNAEQQEIVNHYIEQGYRVLALVHSEYGIIENYLPDDVQLKGLIILSDVIRDNTKELFEFFEKENVKVKIISGDNPIAVAAIAKKAGLKDTQAIDVSMLNETQLQEIVFSHNVFGRVSPDQKKMMVEILQSQNHIVAMTGDGVNDVLALKKSNVSIAMAQGCDAAKQISNIVLLENNFKNLYDILMEGRRVINNIQKVSTLFLSKTVMSIVFSIITLFTPIAFPFIPIQLTLISTLTIGIPGFVLTLEHSKEKIEEKFMQNVLLKSSASAMIFIATSLLTSMILHYFNVYTIEVFSTFATYLALLNGIILLYYVDRKFNLIKLFLLLFILVVITIIVIFFSSFFSLVQLENSLVMILFLVMTMLFSCNILFFNFIYKK